MLAQGVKKTLRVKPEPQQGSGSTSTAGHGSVPKELEDM